MSFYSRWVCGAHRLFSLQRVIDKLIPRTLHLHYGKEKLHLHFPNAAYRNVHPLT